MAVLQEADAIVSEEIQAAGLTTELWQSFAVLPAGEECGGDGDQRTYAETCVIRAVHSEDGMTADWAPLPYEVLRTMSSRIVSEVRGLTGWCTTLRRSRRGPLNGSRCLGAEAWGLRFFVR